MRLGRFGWRAWTGVWGRWVGWVGGLVRAGLGWDRGAGGRRGAGGSEEQKEQKGELLVVGSRRLGGWANLESDKHAGKPGAFANACFG